MTKRLITLAIELSANGEPPTEFRVFRAGVIETTKGLFKFSPESCARVLSAAAKWANEFPIDYEHASLGAQWAPDPAEAGKAAGWFRPAERDGELWATGVTWTARAAEKLRAREYRYMSPTFTADEDGSISELINVALTNLPATHGLDPLVASRGDAPKERTMKTLLSKLGLPETASEAEALVALTKLLELLAATGRATATEALGVIAGWRAAAEEAVSLRAKLAEQEKAAAARRVDELLAEAVRAGRLAPAHEPRMRELAGKHGVEALQSALSVLPVVAGQGSREPAASGSAAASVLSLTAEEREGCAKLGLDPVKYAEHKAASLARGTPAA